MGLIPKIISEPQNVPEKAWVVIANCILTSAIANEERPDSSLCHSLQWNVFPALDDATIFLHPSLTNIRALILVACHGRDIVSPTLCYTLISSACQMARTLGLHLAPHPHVNKKKSTQERTEQLFLFWSLYALDQTLSMTFGRRPILQASDAQSMPVPDYETLQQYAPYLNSGTPSRLRPSGKTNQQGAETLKLKYKETMQTFGALTLLREIHFSKIIARVHVGIFTNSIHSMSQDEMTRLADDLCTDLDLRHEKVDQVCKSKAQLRKEAWLIHML